MLFISPKHLSQLPKYFLIIVKEKIFNFVILAFFFRAEKRVAKMQKSIVNLIYTLKQHLNKINYVIRAWLFFHYLSMKDKDK